jgi:type IV pilus assembly protein PilB
MTKGEYFGGEKIDLRDVEFTPELLACLPATLVRLYRVLPIFNDGMSLRIALADPSHLDVVDEVRFCVQRELELRVADSKQLDEFIQRLYGDGET